MVKNLLVNAGDTVRLEEMGTHSSIFAWEIPWAEKPGRLTVQEVSQDLDIT